MASSSVPSPPPAIGWAALPRDVLWSVFLNLGQPEVLWGAGLACAPWWRLARDEPALWRRVDLTAAADGNLVNGVSTKDSLMGDGPIRIREIEQSGKDRGGVPGRKAMARAAVDRSAGQCEAFWGRADDEVLLYLADRAPSLKSLHVTSHYDVTSEAFSELIKKLPFLEEFELVLSSDAYSIRTEWPEPTNSWAEVFESACGACRRLQRFTVRHAGLHCHAHSYYHRSPLRPKPFSIPVMYELGSLELFGNSFTNDVVLSIVDHCPSLEFLNISDVPYLYLRSDEALQNKLSRIKDVRLPFDDDSDSDTELGFPGSIFY